MRLPSVCFSTRGLKTLIRQPQRTAETTLEALDDKNLLAQLAPLNLLLRSQGLETENLLQRRLTVFDLSAFQDVRSRAAFVIRIGSQVFQYQQGVKKATPNDVKPVRVWVEEASTLLHAKPQLTTLLQEARKLGIQATFITQLHSEVPEYVA